MIKQEQLLKVNLLKKKANIDELTSAYNRKFAFEKYSITLITIYYFH